MEKATLTLEMSKKICKMIEENKSAEEIRKGCKVQANTFRYFFIHAMLHPTQDLEPPFLKLRDAVLNRILKDTVILGMLNAAEQPSEKISRKTTILSDLSKNDRTLLEKQGNASVIEKLEDAIILKVEETVEVIPPKKELYKEILKALDAGEVENPQKKLTDFFQPHPDLPPV